MSDDREEIPTQPDPNVKPPNGVPAPTNRELAIESFAEGEEMVVCPSCGNERRAFLIIDDKCDSCRTKDERAVHPATSLGWPEVRQRRNMILSKTDEAGLTDYPESRKAVLLPIREQLRNVTQKPDPMSAWRELDVIEAGIQTFR